MEPLRERDRPEFLEVLREVYACGDPDGFVATLLRVLPRLIPVDVIGYNEVDPGRQRAVGVIDLPEIVFPGSFEALVRHAGEHPVLQHHLREPRAPALKMSDFLTQRQFHDLGLYQELFRPVRLEHQLALSLVPRAPLVMGIALNRCRRDFTERERRLLNLLGPHLAQAHAQAGTLAALRQAVESGEQGVVALGAGGAIQFATGAARAQLAAYRGPDAEAGERLPEPVQRWLQAQ